MAAAALPPSDSPLGRLLNGPLRPGRIVWIGVRPARRAPVAEVETAQLIAGHGLEGDHYATQHDGARQVTLIAAEDIAAIASFLGRTEIAPELLRRNVVTRGINLAALRNRQFRLGSVLLEASGDCAPCSRMEDALGPGGYNAVRGHGGILARVLEDGIVQLGDAVVRSEA